MDKKIIVIKISNDLIYFSPKFHLPIQATNIPKEHLTFRTKDEIFWLVELIKYDRTSKYLEVKICNYKASDTTNFKEQTPSKDIKKLIFESFDWNELEPLLTSYQVSAFKQLLTNHKESPNYAIETLSVPMHKESKDTPYWMNINLTEQLLKEEFRVSFSESTFKSGYVEFTKFSKKLKSTCVFTIKNEHLLAEFENIKYWFAKCLKTQKFKATAQIKKGESILEIITTSPQIERINPDLIDSIKHQRTLSLIKEPNRTNSEKSLFTSDDIFDQFNEGNSEGNVFNQTEQDLLEFFFVNKPNIRNKNQLTFLSKNLQSEKQKLRYTLKPNFGFLFFVEGQTKNHFIWELLDSHATYIWSFEKNGTTFSDQYSRVECIITFIRTNGRDSYKNEYRNKVVDNDIAFIVIYHNLRDSDSTSAFSDWKAKMEEQLV